MAKRKDNQRRHDNAEVLAVEGMADRGRPRHAASGASDPPLAAKRRTPGRKEPSLTVAVGQKIIAAITNGNFPSTAARLARVSLATLNDWLERGETDEQPYADFAEAFHQAELELEATLVGKWKTACDGDWRAIERFLAKRSRENWGEPDRVDNALIGGGLQITIHLNKFNPPDVDDDEPPQRAIDVTPPKPPEKDPNPALN